MLRKIQYRDAGSNVKFLTKIADFGNNHEIVDPSYRICAISSRIQEFLLYFTIAVFLLLSFASVNAEAADVLGSLPEKAIGYGQNATGGKGGATVRVRNISEFEEAANSEDPLIIEVEGVINTGNRDVKSNKTIIGVTSGATLSGCITLIQGSRNIIVRNLIITSPSSDDGITCFAQNVWVDHCTFVDCADGNLDMTKGANFITVSWCKFYYTNGERSHRFVNLIGDSEGDVNEFRITFHHNWWADHATERMPSVRWGNVHVFNNYYSASGNNYCVRTRIGANVLVENNYFENVKNPWERYVTSGTPGKLKETGNKLVNCVFNAGTDPKVVLIDGKDDVPKPSYLYALESADDIKAKVMAGAGVIFGSTPVLELKKSPIQKAIVTVNKISTDRSIMRIQFSTLSPAPTKVSIFNTQGVKITDLFSSGSSLSKLYISEFDISFLPAGTYICDVLSDDNTNTFRTLFSRY